MVQFRQHPLKVTKKTLNKIILGWTRGTWTLNVTAWLINVLRLLQISVKSCTNVEGGKQSDAYAGKDTQEIVVETILRSLVKLVA